jgi:predicted hydrolase (HD superfamily)
MGQTVVTIRRTPDRALTEAAIRQTSRDDLTASVNVQHSPATVGIMSQAGWAEDLARALLEKPLPHRWAHSRSVAATARALAPILGRHADTVTAAAWLHDIGYAPALHDCGFHPLDGARYLRDVERADPLLCRLVAHHSCARIEAAERRLADDLFREFRPAARGLSDALIYCDMTTGPQGQPMTVEERFAEIRHRYGPDHVVTRALERSAPELAAAAARITRRLTGHPREPRLAQVPVLAGAC